MANREWSMEQLRTKAESYCAKAEHCCYDVRIKLMQWGATNSQCDEIIQHLYIHKYIDDVRYCHAFVHDKLLYQGWGRIKLSTQLRAKGLPNSAINHAIQHIDEQKYMKVLRHLIQQRCRNNTEQLIRFCMQRGFTYDEINRAKNQA